MKFKTNARRSKDIMPHERVSAEVSRRVAGEGIVLLKNEGALPFSLNDKIALYGEGAALTVRGGIGSGEVNCRYVVSIWEGLKAAGYTITTEKWLQEYLDTFAAKKKAYTAEMRKKAGFASFKNLNYILGHPFMNPEGMAITSKYLGQKAKNCLYVLSRQAGENVDRMPVKGDFLLSDRETENIKTCCKEYENVVVVINVGGYIDLSPLDELPVAGIVFFGQQGAEGGHALADIISGKVTPSGHLTASWPLTYGDVPFGDQFSTINGNTVFEDYQEGIYVGYRYYDTFGVKPRYPFGYGMSYTAFESSYEAAAEGEMIRIRAKVKNVGKCSGKEVVQVYVSCPGGRLDKEYQRLAGFAKTRLLAVGEEDSIEITFSVRDLASYEEAASRTILESGEYVIRAGNHSRNTGIIGVLTLADEVIIAQHQAVCPRQHEFTEIKPEKKEKPEGFAPPQDTGRILHIAIDPGAISTTSFTYHKVKPRVGKELDKMQTKLAPKDLAYICAGAGLDVGIPQHHDFIIPGACGYSTSKFEKAGIPAISFCDGPAGIRLFDECVEYGRSVRMTKPVMASFDFLPTLVRKFMIRPAKEGKMLYQYTTSFPSGLAMAQTWNVDAIGEVGGAVQKEMAVYGAEYWLAPGMNIHRNPLCGRNYEYYSEDPLLSGTLAAAMCGGVQSKPGFGVTVKHFAGNNQEIDRRTISANIGERALREIYLRNFEIAVKKGKPKALMTSYNKINGIYAAENYDTVTKVLRNEWGFDGLIMTDWTTEKNMLNSAKAIAAGVNLMMPGIGSDRQQILAAMKAGSLSEETMRISASYVLAAIAESRLYRSKQSR